MFFRNYRYYQELLYVIAIIAILTGLTLQYYAPCRAKGRIISMIGKFNAARADIALHYALHGVWPENASKAASTVSAYGPYASAIYADAVIRNGAFNYTFHHWEPGLSDKTITLRPVIRQDDPFGPVYWVAGKKDPEKDLKIIGKDETDIETYNIPMTLL